MQGLDFSLKTAIVSELSLEDMARLSMTCREWHSFFLGYTPFQERAYYNKLMCRIGQTERRYKYMFEGKLKSIDLVRYCLSILLGSTAAQTGANLERLISIYELILGKFTSSRPWVGGIQLAHETTAEHFTYEMPEFAAVMCYGELAAKQYAIRTVFFSRANVFVSSVDASVFVNADGDRITDLLKDEAAYQNFLSHWATNK
jgi:hypothetical protein